MNNNVNILLNSDIEENRELGKILKDELDLQDRLHLSLIQEIQKVFPDSFVTGSAALYLHGIRLKRWSFMKPEIGDLDIIAPRYVDLSLVRDIRYEIGEENATIFSYKKTTKIDFWVDPKQRWTVIELNGFPYKVGRLEDIWEAKIRFGKQGKEKHIEDLYESMGIGVQRNKDEDEKIDRERKILERLSNYSTS